MGPKEVSMVVLKEGVVLEALRPDLIPEKEPPPSSATSVYSAEEGGCPTPDGSKSVIIESHRRIFGQVVFPFFVAGMGMVGAGVYLDIVQVRKFFKLA
jgi:hypothetical protein